MGGGRRLREVLREELVEPLGMTSTALGAPRAWAERIVPLRARFAPGAWLGPEDIEIMNEAVHEDAEMPWVGSVSSVADLFRLAEMVRRGGELDGVRILSPAIIDRATTLPDRRRPERPLQPLWRRGGLGARAGQRRARASCCVARASTTDFFGTLASPRTFGNFGAGSSLFWVDPEKGLTFVCLTAGVMEEAPNILRFQRLSDMAHAAAV